MMMNVMMMMKNVNVVPHHVPVNNLCNTDRKLKRRCGPRVAKSCSEQPGGKQNVVFKISGWPWPLRRVRACYCGVCVHSSATSKRSWILWSGEFGGRGQTLSSAAVSKRPPWGVFVVKSRYTWFNVWLHVPAAFIFFPCPDASLNLHLHFRSHSGNRHPAGKPAKSFIWEDIRGEGSCHNIPLHQSGTFESRDGASHRSKADLGTSGKRRCTIPTGSCIRGSGFDSGWQFFRCLNLVFVFIARPGAKLPRLFLLFIIIITVRGSAAMTLMLAGC